MPPLPQEEVQDILIGHVQALHEFYGEFLGPRIARKHVGWYLKEHDSEGEFRRIFNAIEDAEKQIDVLRNYFYTTSI